MKMMIVLGILMSGIVGCGGAPAQAQRIPQYDAQMVEDTSQFPIAPSEAAIIAKDSVPGSKVLNVKLLPSGVYAVTLKVGGSVTRVMVDATSGAVT